MTPIAAFDIFPDGTATPCPDTTPRPAEGAAYRWLHVDLADPDLPDWAAETLPEDAGNALVQAETRPRCDTLGPGLIVNLRGVNLNPGQETEDMISLRLWAEPGLLVTVRKRRIFAVEDIRQLVLVGEAPPTIAHWVELVAEGMTERIEAAILQLEDATDDLEEAILDDEPVSEDLAPLRRKLIKLHRFLAPQRDALAKLVAADGIVAAERAGLRESANRAARALETLNTLTERAKAMQDQIHIANAERMNRNSMILSIVASIFLPLGFITGLFGVNLAGIPAASNPAAFGLLALICLLIALLLLWIFRKMDWF